MRFEGWESVVEGGGRRRQLFENGGFWHFGWEVSFARVLIESGEMGRDGDWKLQQRRPISVARGRRFHWMHYRVAAIRLRQVFEQGRRRTVQVSTGGFFNRRETV